MNIAKPLTILALAGMVACAAAWGQVSDSHKSQDRIIKEGEFAILYVKFLALKAPKDGWSGPEAIKALQDLKIHHPERWNPDADLVEGVMVELVRSAGIELVTAYPDRKVTVRQANAVFTKFKRIFNPQHPEYRTTTGEPATFIELEGNPGVPKSPASFY